MDIEVEHYLELRLLILAEDINFREIPVFKNDVFEMRAYSACNCGLEEQIQKIDHPPGVYNERQFGCPTCNDVLKFEADHPHLASCATMIPNFKCGDFEVTWYKTLGRSMKVNRSVTKKELRQMFQQCEASLNEEE